MTCINSNSSNDCAWKCESKTLLNGHTERFRFFLIESNGGDEIPFIETWKFCHRTKIKNSHWLLDRKHEFVKTMSHNANRRNVLSIVWMCKMRAIVFELIDREARETQWKNRYTFGFCFKSTCWSACLAGERPMVEEHKHTHFSHQHIATDNCVGIIKMQTQTNHNMKSIANPKWNKERLFSRPMRGWWECAFAIYLSRERWLHWWIIVPCSQSKQKL